MIICSTACAHRARPSNRSAAALNASLCGALALLGVIRNRTELIDLRPRGTASALSLSDLHLLPNPSTRLVLRRTELIDLRLVRTVETVTEEAP